MSIETSNHIVDTSTSFPCSLSSGFLRFQSLLLATHVLRIVVSSWGINPFILVKFALCPRYYPCCKVYVISHQYRPPASWRAVLVSSVRSVLSPLVYLCLRVRRGFSQAALIKSGTSIFLTGVFKPFTPRRIINMVGFKPISLLLIFCLSHSFCVDTFLMSAFLKFCLFSVLGLWAVRLCFVSCGRSGFHNVRHQLS